MILFYIMFYAFIVCKSLISNVMSEKTFENAMLRTLGWKRENISIIAVQKIFVLYSIPGAAFALLLAYYACSSLKVILSNINDRPVIFKFEPLAIVLGLVVAFILPIVSLIHPLY